MPTPSEIDAFESKWGLARSAGGEAPAVALNQPPPETQTTNAVSPEQANAFESKWGLLPLSRQALQQNAPPASLAATPQMDVQGLYGRTDEQGQPVPVDQTSGIPLGRYWRVAKQSDPEAKAAVLQKMYPDKKVRILDTGDVTLEVTDSATGKSKDVVINPTGIDSHDLLDLAASAPEIGVEIATGLATKGRGVLRTTAQMITSAFAGGFTGKVRDVASRAAEGIPVRPGEISHERNMQTGLDLFGQGALGAAGKATRALSPFAREVEPGSLAFNQREGVDFLKRNYNVDYPTTPGMRTGSPALLALEAAEAPMPGSRTVIGKFKEEANKAVQEAQGLALGTVTPEEQIGADAFQQIRSRVISPIENGLNQARQKAIERGDNRILSLIDQVVGAAPSRVTPTEGGEVATAAFQRRLTRAQTAVDEAYGQVNKLPGGSGDVLDGSAAADAAAEIRKELPAVAKQVDQPTGILDQFGNPGTKEVTQRTELATGIPAGLDQALNDLESLKGGKVSLQTLTNMKNSAYDSIAAFKTAHGDRKDRWFKKIAEGYEQAIQGSIDTAENLDLKNALVNARDVYKREMVPLERVGVKELAKDTFDAGHLAPEEVANRIFEGPKAIQNYKMLEETLGADNVAFRALKRAYVDTKLADAYDPVLKSYDSDKLGATFKRLFVDKPELAQKIMGGNYNKLMEALTVRSAIGKAGVQAIDEGELRTLLNLKDPTVQDLKDVLVMGKRRDTAYVNSIFKDVADGVSLGDFNPASFVNKLRNTDLPTDFVKQGLSRLDNDTRQAIATAEFYRLLNASSLSEGETLSRALAGQQVNISPKKLVEALGTGAQRDRARLLLGEDLPAPGIQPPVIAGKGEAQPAGANRFQVLDALVRTLAPKEAAKTSFSSLGSIGSGMAIRQIVEGPLKYASSYAKNALLATAYVRMGLGKLITNVQFDAEASAIAANTLIASEPFLRAAGETFGSEGTKSIIANVKRSIDRYVQELHDTPEGRKRMATRQFMQGQNVPMRIQAQP